MTRRPASTCAHSAATPLSRVSGSSTSWIVPPHGSPKRCASSAVTPYFTASGRASGAMPLACTRAIRSSSMQPPDTEPTTSPSSRTASIAPSGRGDEPHVFTTVTSSTRRPSSIQRALVFSTSRSTLSIIRFPLLDGPAGAGRRSMAGL
ncbi:hypothetical protein BGV71_17380 [Burkholderia ubonensis]|nr:hypothetical protein BGV71_17380 [Burkholderia ubonensis]